MVEERVSRGQRKADNENIFSFCKLLCSRSSHRIYRLMVFGFVKTGRNNHFNHSSIRLGVSSLVLTSPKAAFRRQPALRRFSKCPSVASFRSTMA